MIRPSHFSTPACSAPPSPRYTTARFAITAPHGRRWLPSVTETLPLAEQIRHALLALCRRLARRYVPRLADADLWPLSPAFWGKDDHGRPRTGHEHAFFLPVDEDGDGRLDHLTLVARMGYNALECDALDQLRHLPFGDGDPFALLRIGLGCEEDFRALPLEEATVWRSATPFVVTRYPKLRGQKRDRPEQYASPRDFARHILQMELQRRPLLPPARTIVEEAGIGTAQLQPVQFQRWRRKPQDDGGRRPSGGFRITFAAPVRGPLCLGHACHFGLGLFLPSSGETSRGAK